MGRADQEFYQELIRSVPVPLAPVVNNEEAEEESLPLAETAEEPDPDEERGEEPAPLPAPEPVTAGTIFTHHDAHPIALLTLLTDQYSPIWLDWEPETVRDMVKRDFGSSITALNWNKIQAARTCSLISTPWEKWGVFSVVNAPFNNNLPDFRILHKPTIVQITATIDSMGLIGDHSLSEEVEMFIAACFLDEGVFYFPPPLGPAQHWASRLIYRCRKCGKIDIDQDNDRCDSCGAPDSELEKEYERDHRPVEARWNEVQKDPTLVDQLAMNPIDTQVAKLVVAEQYRRYRRDQLEYQLKAVRNG